MLSPTEISASADAVARFIEKNGIKFERGNPVTFFNRLGQVHVDLTLPVVSKEHEETVLLLKNYCGLWTALVDDEMDLHGSRTELDATIQLLVDCSQGKTPPAESTSSAVRTLKEVLTKLPTDPAKAQLREAFYFDLWVMVNGFVYEDCINNKATLVANSTEYARYSALTASLKHYLDLDYLFSKEEPDPAAYRLMRKGYDHLALAIKFASDIGSIRRELKNEYNLNLVTILGMEEGTFFATHRLNDTKLKEALSLLQPQLDKVRDLAMKELTIGRDILEQLPMTQGVVKTEELTSGRDTQEQLPMTQGVVKTEELTSGRDTQEQLLMAQGVVKTEDGDTQKRRSMAQDVVNTVNMLVASYFEYDRFRAKK
ncbi:terpene synthase family protein [Archangium lipolyticum]|uniref:terpene synthase family protein n=1 Tax=Archangium lipolyticum TaxID=2970465 RepID=UPI00214A5783|nr:hypothetical protein [Archangium lipolyticum]